MQLEDDISSVQKESIKYMLSLKDGANYNSFTQVFQTKPWVVSVTERVKKIQIVYSHSGFASNEYLGSFEVNLL